MGKMKNKGRRNQVKSSLPTLDLHAYMPEDVFDAVEKFLAKQAQAPTVRIMPGKGTGKVRAKVEEYLRLARYHWSFEKLPSGAANEGVMIVYME